jgi:hypothetical protein
MSTMKWTFKGTKDAFTPNADKITVTEYEFYIDSRGQAPSITTEYYEGVVPQDKSSMGQYRPPQGKKLNLGKDFTFESPKKDISNNKTVMYLGFIVVGYFIYKYMLKP